MKRAHGLSCVLAAGAWLAATAPAHACGQCDEDKMAATYDYEIAQQAARERRTVVFCEVKGALDVAALRAAARSVTGLDGATLRVSREPPALSFVVDPAVREPESAVRALQQAIGSRTTLRKLPGTLP